MEQIVTIGGSNASMDLGRIRTEVLTAARSLNAEADCGKVFFLNLAGGFTVTLPSIAAAGAGWNCKFVVKTAPTTAYIITELAASDTDKIITNGINELEVDTTEDGPTNTGHTTVTLAANVAIAGDYVSFLCDGANWFCTGQTAADGGVTLA